MMTSAAAGFAVAVNARRRRRRPLWRQCCGWEMEEEGSFSLIRSLDPDAADDNDDGKQPSFGIVDGFNSIPEIVTIKYIQQWYYGGGGCCNGGGIRRR